MKVKTAPPSAEEEGIPPRGWSHEYGRENKTKNKLCHTVPASIEHSPLTHGEVSSVFMPWD